MESYIVEKSPLLLTLLLLVFFMLCHTRATWRAWLYHQFVRFPVLILAIIFGLSIFYTMQLKNIFWETDARVYLPKGHPAIKYDELVDNIFGVKDSIVIGIQNKEKGIYNEETLRRIKRITDKISNVYGVIAKRKIDVASLSTASVFYGTEDEFGSKPLMPKVPTSEAEMNQFRQGILENEDILVGNLISADGKSAMIRAKLKEGKEFRYMAYWQIKNILDEENGQSQKSKWWDGKNVKQGKWQKQEGGNKWWSGDKTKTSTSANQDQKGQQWTKQGDWQQKSGGNDGQGEFSSLHSELSDLDINANQANRGSSTETSKITTLAKDHGDVFYMAGRPAIEVMSGLFALEDMSKMIPILIFAIIITLALIFKSVRGIVLPLGVLAIAITWSMGFMAAAGVPLYTISTMLPVILVAVGIGSSIHILGHYYDIVLDDPHAEKKSIVEKLMGQLSIPLVTTSVTTAAGFLSLTMAEMPPFRVFGVVTALGILFCWLISISFIPSVLAMLKPRVGAYYKKKRAQRLYDEDSHLARGIVGLGRFIMQQRHTATLVVILLTAVSLYGASFLRVDSSWMSDFRTDSKIYQANEMLNKNFDGTIFLNVVVEGEKKNQLKSKAILQKIEALQNHVEQLEYVGDSLSVVDYLKSMNKTLNAGKEQFKILPKTEEEIAQYLYLFSVSGRPEQLDEVIDYDYKKTLVSFMIKTDRTRHLQAILNKVHTYVEKEFQGLDVSVNYAGSANNSYIWADLLISSQVTAILLSKIAVFFISALLLWSIFAGIYVVMPVMVTTLFVAGGAGLLGIPLDVSTTLAAGIAIGVGVDFAIHYLYRHMRELEATGDPQHATLESLRRTGRTIIFNALVVSAGFLVLLGSQFPPHIKLGMFVSVYMIISCAVALIVLPLLLSRKKISNSRSVTIEDSLEKVA